MIREALSEHAWLWPLVWQSTLCLAAGLGGSVVLWKRPARAHQALVIGLIAAAVIPALSHLVKRQNWGLFVEQAPVASSQTTESVAYEMPIPPELPAPTEPVYATSHRPVDVRPTRLQSEVRPDRWLFPAWLLVGSALFLRLTARFFLSLRLVRDSRPAVSEHLTQPLATAKARLGLQNDIALRSSERVLSPMIWCWSARPILLVPGDVGHNGDHLDWTSILCHELAHRKRRDHVSGLFAELMVCALPWQALLWWAQRRLARLNEEACDDWVVACGRCGVDYAQTLLDLTPQGRLAFAPSVVSSKKPLAQRIRRILQDHCASPHPGLRWTIAAIALAACTILTIAFAQTRPAAPNAQNSNSQTQDVSTAEEQSSVNQDRIVLRLVDPNGRPVHEAKAAPYVGVGTTSILGSRLKWRWGNTSDDNGQVVIETKDLFRGQRDKAAVYILHERRGIGAIHQIVRGHPDTGSPVILKPVCRVHGTLDSTGLASIGMPLRLAHMYIDSGHNSFIVYSSRERQHAFEVPLPPGTYRFGPYGAGAKDEDTSRISASTKTEVVPVTVSEGQRDLDLGVIDLRPTKIATLIGHPAPEIGPMKAWKNGSPVTLAQLRGQIVWLHFSGEYPSASGDLPELVELHKAFGSTRLAIVAIYNCASMEELEQRWAEANARYGGVQEVPFRIAIDGGEPTFYEGTSRERHGATYGRYDITNSPTDILIDATGNVIGESNALRAKEIISRMLVAVPQTHVAYPVNDERTQASLVIGQARTLRFPQDRSLGTLYVRDLGWGDWYGGWEAAGQAQGERVVPAGKQVKLEANAESADLSPLERLGPDDLQMLGFGWEQVTVGSLTPLAKLTGLRALNLQRTEFDPNEFRHLTGLRQLEVLRLGDYKLTDASMQYLGKLTSLKSLALWGTGISDEGLKHLEGLTNLTFLALNNCTITDEGLRYLHGMTALEGLQLSQTKITDTGLVHLQHLSRLKHIKLDYTKINDAGLKRLETLSQLENVWLDMTSITDTGLPSLAKLRNLKELYLIRTRITSAGLRHLTGLPQLQHIIVDGIGDEGVRHLSQLPAMSQLQLVDTTITPESAKYFKAMPALKELLLSGDMVDDTLLDALTEALPECKVWDPQRSREYPMPEWRRKFEAAYRLAEGEVLKRLAPPFIPERMDFYKAEHEHQAELIPDGPDSMTFHWDRKLKNWGMSFGHRVGTLNHVLTGVLGLKSYEYSGTKELLDIDLPGDWIIRDDASQEAKLRALEAIMDRELGWKIHFQKGRVIGEVIVATGKFTFHPPVGTYENTSVHLYVGESDSDEGAGGGTANSIGEFLRILGDRVSLPVLDQTESDGEIRIPYRHHRSSRLDRVEDDQERFRQLQELLARLTTQTELQFEIRTQPIEVWQITAENYQ